LVCLLVAGVRAANIVLNGTCSAAVPKVTFTGQTVGANDTVTSISQPYNASAIQTVLFNASSIYHVPAILFTTFPNLQNLYMQGIGVREIRNNTFLNAKKLVYLSLLLNDIFAFPANTFSGATSLQILEYATNYYNTNYNYTAVDANAFRGLPSLVYVYLLIVNMPTIAKTSFSDSPNLQTISIRNAMLGSVDPTAFCTLKNLKSLALNQNNLTTIDGTIFQQNSLLNYIDLSNNKLNAIHQATFSNLTKLTTLDLANNVCVNQTFISPNSTTPINLNDVSNALCNCDLNCKNWSSRVG
jgi:Leucine-rich repeat (LRR) protein